MLGLEGNGIQILCKFKVGHFEEKMATGPGLFNLIIMEKGAESFHMLKSSLGVDPNKYYDMTFHLTQVRTENRGIEILKVH